MCPNGAFREVQMPGLGPGPVGRVIMSKAQLIKTNRTCSSRPICPIGDEQPESVPAQVRRSREALGGHRRSREGNPAIHYSAMLNSPVEVIDDQVELTEQFFKFDLQDC